MRTPTTVRAAAGLERAHTGGRSAVEQKLHTATTPPTLWLAGVALLASCAIEHEESARSGTSARTAAALTLDERNAACAEDPRVLAGAVSVEVCVGADLFLRETFGGNGRSCATCHRVDNNFAIDPTFIATLPPDDPLFVAEFDPALANLERPEELRARGLILENPDGFQPDPNIRFVLRSVPHNLSMGVSVDRAPDDSVTPPEHRTGWGGDGAPGQGELRDFLTGAITQHYPLSLGRVAGVDFQLPTDEELDRVDLFMRRLGRLNDLDLAAVQLSDPGAEDGRLAFLSDAARCNVCHANAGANASFGGGGNRNFDTGVEDARNAALAAFPRDGGFLKTPENPDGSFGDGTFNTPPLVEAADTGPFFHTDTTVSGASAHNTASAVTIEQAIAFYDTPAFNSSPAAAAGQIDLSGDEIEDIGRFLRVLNAAFNAQMALKRIEAALMLVDAFANDEVAFQHELCRLAAVEVEDAITVLSEAPSLNNGVQGQLHGAMQLLAVAQSTPSARGRRAQIAQAENLIQLATTGLGDGLVFEIGEGTVMF